MKEEVSVCPVCSSQNLAKFISAIDYTVSHETFDIKKCNVCSLGITTPRPDKQGIVTYYKSDDYISHSGKSSNLIDKIYLFARSFTLRWKRQIILKNTQSENTNLLDYGCGTGEFLHACKQDKWNVTGVEPSSFARQKAEAITGANIHSTLQETQQKKFGAITLWHVLEHVENLSEVLGQLNNLLEKNGTLFIAVPNHISDDGKYYSQYWAGYDVPRHLWHFNPENMKKLLGEKNLTVQKIVPMKLDAYYISLLSEKYKNGGHTLGGMIRAVAIALRSNIRARKTGNYSSLIYIASK